MGLSVTKVTQLFVSLNLRKVRQFFPKPYSLPVSLGDISMGQLVFWRNSCDFCKYNEALVASKNSVSPPNRERAFIPRRGVSALPSCLICFSL